ncbi:MAG: hypothetical protein RMN25_09870 [Anaerolineae bacterium]|nr:hypothetical protein [Thermoflexales bacterium]MDW8408075.1 hypothetical protein [Anaerolineae bacterium]
MKKLQKNIYYHTTRDGINIGCVIGDTGVVSIDLPSSAEEALDWRAQITALTNKPLRAVVFTSADRASSAALAALAPHPGPLSIPAIIHEAGFTQLYAALEASQPKSPEPLNPVQLREQAVLPEATFSEATTIVVGAENPLFLDVKRVGGYSAGSAIVAVRDADIVFAGDLITSKEPAPLVGCNLDEWIAALTEMKRSLKTAMIVPGRGLVADAETITETLTYLKAARTTVQRLVRSRKTRADAAGLATELLALYPLKTSKSRRSVNVSAIERRIALGLEYLFDQLSKPADPPITS